MKIVFSKPGLPQTGMVVVGVFAERELTSSARSLDESMNGGLVRAIEASRFKGGKGQSLTVLAPAGTRLDRVYVYGLGEAKDVDILGLQAVGGQIYAALSSKRAASVHVAVDRLEDSELAAHEMAAEIALGARLRSYRFDKYRTKQKKDDKPSLKTLHVHCEEGEKARAAYRVSDKVADGVFLTRDLVSEPANVLFPESFAKIIKDELEPLGVEVNVLKPKDMKELGMGALLGVAQGSAREARLVTMTWWGAGKPAKKGRTSKDKAPLAFVGKGVTFDTGGISIKPSAGMEEMKWDMGGAGVVTGLMKALAGRKARVNAVGVVGLVENMPSGTAQRPGDIVTSMSGQTIEVLNTDAEGRLVLADALWYCMETFKPKLMVDLATLTGAIIISLGHEMAGVFSNNDELATNLVAAGTEVGEHLWRLPLGDEYDKMLRSDAADMKNIGGRGAGSITAAQFLQRFVGDVPWAHLDIAGVSWSKKGTPTVPKGGTAFGVRLLDRIVADFYEK